MATLDPQGCTSILGRAARLHSLSCLFMPSPRLVLRSEESIMLIVNLVMSIADISALFDGPPPSELVVVAQPIGTTV